VFTEIAINFPLFSTFTKIFFMENWVSYKF
jgi:hypothetical protein